MMRLGRNVVEIVVCLLWLLLHLVAGGSAFSSNAYFWYATVCFGAWVLGFLAITKHIHKLADINRAQRRLLVALKLPLNLVFTLAVLPATSGWGAFLPLSWRWATYVVPVMFMAEAILVSELPTFLFRKIP